MSEQAENLSPYPEYDGMTAMELAVEMSKVKKELDSIKAVKTKLEKRHDHIRITKMPDLMESEGLENFKLDGIGRIGLTADLWVSIPASEKDKVFLWFGDNGHGDIIKSTINASTLKSLMKAMMKKGEETPEGIKITPYQRASITQVKN